LGDYDPHVTSELTMTAATLPVVMLNAGTQAENVDQGSADSDTRQIYDDGKMSVEKFDDALATLTLAITLFVIAFGFVFNL
jgi:hypothetical protein